MNTTTEPTALPKPKAGSPTAYVILERKPPDGWTEAATVTAASGDHAIRKHANGRAGVFVAVPARSWHPRTIKVETRQIVTFE